MLTNAPKRHIVPFGMRHATLVASDVRDGTDGFAYDDEAQVLRLVHQTGDAEFDRRILAQVILTRTIGATDTDGQTPTTPKDFGTDSD